MSSFEIDPDISKARTIHSSFYTSEEYLQVSIEKIFSASWQYAGCTKDLNERSAYPFNFIGNFLPEPLFIIKDNEGQIKCFSNVCTHRGNLLITEPCNQLKMITCKYHGRSFNLDGKLKFMPEFKEVNNFPDETDNLQELPIFQLGNLLFTTLKQEINPQLLFGDIFERFKAYPLEKLIYRKDLSKEFIVEAHWALYCENYLEGFHIPFVHEDLNEIIDYSNYQTEIFPYSNLQLGISKSKEDCFLLPPDSKDYGLNIAAYYFWVFPNLMFNFYPWGLSLNIIEPIGKSQSKVKFLSFIYDDTKMEHGAGADLEKVEFEDEKIVVNVQKGVRSRFYEHGRYSVTKEQGTHHFHRLLAEYMNRKS